MPWSLLYPERRSHMPLGSVIETGTDAECVNFHWVLLRLCHEMLLRRPVRLYRAERVAMLANVHQCVYGLLQIDKHLRDSTLLKSLIDQFKVWDVRAEVMVNTGQLWSLILKLVSVSCILLLFPVTPYQGPASVSQCAVMLSQDSFYRGLTEAELANVQSELIGCQISS